MPGDLVDTLDMVDSEAERNRFLNFLSSLSQLATVIISVGNHDMYRKPKGGRHGWQYGETNQLFDQIRQLPKYCIF